MAYSMSERLVRQRLRDNKGRAYCAECMAKDLGRNPAELKPAMEALALRERFPAAWLGRHRPSGGGPIPSFPARSLRNCLVPPEVATGGSIRAASDAGRGGSYRAGPAPLPDRASRTARVRSWGVNGFGRKARPGSLAGGEVTDSSA
jgi:hypothetical protein